MTLSRRMRHLVLPSQMFTLLLGPVLVSSICGCGGAASRPDGSLDSKDTLKRVYALENLRDAPTASENDLQKALELLVDDSRYGNKIVGRKQTGANQQEVEYRKDRYTSDMTNAVGNFKISDLAFEAVTVHQPAAADLAAQRLAEEALIPEEDRVPEDVQMPGQPLRFSGDKLKRFNSRLIDVILDCCEKMPDYDSPEAMKQLQLAGKQRP